MISYKSATELSIMKEGGAILHQVFADIKPLIKEGAATEEIDKKAEALIREAGGEPAFKRVSGYKWATCICINEQVVHTPPSNRVIRSGDVVTVDAGVYYKGFNTDKADTFLVGKGTDEIKKFLAVGRQALNRAIKEARPGRYIADISRVIYQNINGSGYYIVKELTGHGVGRRLHEDPAIPGFVDDRLPSVKIAPGMALAIEVIYCQSKGRLILEKDRWSLKTKTDGVAACFEETVAIDNHDTVILT